MPQIWPVFTLQFIVQILGKSFSVLLGEPECFVKPLVHKAQSNLQFHSIIHNKSCDWSDWRLQIFRDDWNNSIKLVVTSWSRKLFITLGKQSSVVLPSNVELNVTLISEGNNWFQFLALQSCPILAPPLSCMLLGSVVFHGRWLEPADVSFQKGPYFSIWGWFSAS